MKAIVYNAFGNTDVLKLEDINPPKISPFNMLINVSYAGVNPIDWKIREGYLDGFIDYNFPIIPGWDVSGTVVKTGSNVKKFKPGDSIYAMTVSNPIGIGTYAQQTLVKEDDCSLIPKTIDESIAAGIPLASIAANDGLFRLGKLKKGQKVLIHQAAGGVGTFAIQLAIQAGAIVYSTCSTNNIKTVNTFGNHRVIDYTNENFIDVINNLEPEGLDIVLDGVGGETFINSHKVIKPNGIMVTMGDNVNTDLANKYNINSVFLDSTPNGLWLSNLAKNIDNNNFILPKTKIMNLCDAYKAHELSKGGHVSGKIVLKI